MITLTGQQLSAATSMVRWPTQSAQTILGYFRAWTVDDPGTGPDAVLAVGPRRLATNLGMSPDTAIRGMAWLEAHGVLVCHERGEGSAPSVWSIEGDLTRWRVEWRVEREKALLVVASLISCAPYGPPEPRFYRATYRHPQTGQREAIYRPLVVHRGGFVARPRTEIPTQISAFRAVQAHPQIAPTTGALSFSLVPSEPSTSKEEEEIIETNGETAAARAVLAAIYDVTGHELWDGPRHRARSRVVDAVAGVEDVTPIVAELHRARPRQWMAAIEMVVRMAQGSVELEVRGPDLAARAESLRRRIAFEESEIVEREAKGYPVDDELQGLQSLRDELTACENGYVTAEGATA